MVVLRPYQNNALSALEQYWNAGGTAGLIDMATATGKSLVLAEAMRRTIAANPSSRILLAVHMRELVEQDVDALLSIWPNAPYGICSDGLDRRDHDQQIIFGTIQTLYHDVAKLGRRDLLLVDEVQLVPRDGDGMYLSLIDTLRAGAPDLRMVGASATCFRLDSGYLDRGDGALFDKTVFSYGIRNGINDGWLAPLSSKASTAKIDVTGVGRRGGEFIPGEFERAVNVADVVETAVAELVEQGEDRRSWLCFCCGIDHAYAVRDSIRRRGISCETVVAETPSSERDEIFAAFGAGRIRCLTGVNVFSVGFNIPQVDLIALLRPTCSPGLLIQQVGRGTRKAPGKTDCRILDFAQNIRRHGPVDAIYVNGRTSANPGDILTKTLPRVPGGEPVGGNGVQLLRPHLRQRTASAQACRQRRCNADPRGRDGLVAGAAFRIFAYTANVTIRAPRQRCASTTCAALPPTASIVRRLDRSPLLRRPVVARPRRK